MRPENTRVWRKGLRHSTTRQHHEPRTDPVLAGVETRRLERAAAAAELDREYQSGERGGLDPDLELVALTTPNIRILLLSDPENDQPS